MNSDERIKDKKLRPEAFDDYIGQTNIVKTLRLFITALKKRGKSSEHILFYGPPGIGKTTLAYVVAKELGGNIKVTSGAAIQKSADLAAVLTNLKDNDILFIDEIHRLPKTVEEILYPVIEENFLNIIIGQGPSARIVSLPISKITIIGATTRLALLSAPLRDRFGMILRLDYYTDAEMEKIINRSADILGLPLSKNTAKEIAKRSRRTPRFANRILKRARDIFDVDKHKIVDSGLLLKLFNLLEMDNRGLTNIDVKYLKLINDKFQNLPVGIETIASALSEDRQTVEEFIEPYLLQIGFIKKTPRGRVLTKKAQEHLGITGDQEKLL
jgi:Holliday junction DNA helicase RuvB